MSKRKVVLITGANRGLGAEFVRQYCAEGWQVIACSRSEDPCAEFPECAKFKEQFKDLVTFKKLDVADPTAVVKLASELRGTAIDVLLNNAGVYHKEKFGSIDYKAWQDSFAVNTMAPIHMAECFVEHVAQSEMKTMAFVTSLMGSIDDNGSGGSYSYRSSKAALNMAVKSLSIDIKPRGIKMALLHPGWVPTRMGGPNGCDNIVSSIQGMKKIINNATVENSGKFYAYDGEEIKW